MVLLSWKIWLVQIRMIWVRTEKYLSFTLDVLVYRTLLQLKAWPQIRAPKTLWDMWRAWSVPEDKSPSSLNPEFTSGKKESNSSDPEGGWQKVKSRDCCSKDDFYEYVEYARYTIHCSSMDQLQENISKNKFKALMTCTCTSCRPWLRYPCFIFK